MIVLSITCLEYSEKVPTTWVRKNPGHTNLKSFVNFSWLSIGPIMKKFLKYVCIKYDRPHVTITLFTTILTYLFINLWFSFVFFWIKTLKYLTSPYTILTTSSRRQLFYYITYKFGFLWVSMENHEVLVYLKEITIHIYEIECLPLSCVHHILMYHITEYIIN